MRFTVVWLQDARDELTERWLASTDRDAVTRAAHRIDQELSIDPMQRGTPLAEGLRKLDVPPLRVYFSVRDQDRIVEITNIAELRTDDGLNHNS